jgi:protein gp37
VGAKTRIEWTDSTWNPLRGCSRVSEGCRHCYAETTAYRFSGEGKPYAGLAVLKNGHASWTGKVEFVEKHLLDPLKWNFVHSEDCTKSFADGKDYCDCRQNRIFVNSMSDLFHENVPLAWIDRIFAVMAICPKHVFQVLTKRPARMLEYFQRPLLCGDISAAAARIIEAHWPRLRRMPHGFRWSVDEPGVCRISGGVGEYWPLANVWLGVSVENQAAADERIPLLLKTPAAVRFISAEPLLGAVDLNSSLGGTRWLGGQRGCSGTHCGVGSSDCPCERHHHHDDRCGAGLDWVICGGESGPGARPMHPAWPQIMQGQCERAGVPFFFKQWGEWSPIKLWVPSEKAAPQVAIQLDGAGVPMDVNPDDIGGHRMMRVGKHAAGALLDGVEYKQFPALACAEVAE